MIALPAPPNQDSRPVQKYGRDTPLRAILVSIGGAGTTIIQEINIGSHCIIGAGSLVIRNVSENKVAFGHPAKEVMI